MSDKLNDLEYTPEVVYTSETGQRYALMLVEVDQCPICQQLMVRGAEKWSVTAPFPYSSKCDFATQIHRAGWRIQSLSVNDKSENVCMVCADKGLITFDCYLCDKQKPSNEILTSIGVNSPHHLCKSCYETVPAKKWHSVITYLEGRHQWENR
jgi:hypothetical protein